MSEHLTAKPFPNIFHLIEQDFDGVLLSKKGNFMASQSTLCKSCCSYSMNNISCVNNSSQMLWSMLLSFF